MYSFFTKPNKATRDGHYTALEDKQTPKDQPPFSGERDSWSSWFSALWQDRKVGSPEEEKDTGLTQKLLG